MVGHERFSGIVAGQALAQLLGAVRLYVNYLQPSFKLQERIREGAKIKKLYDPPATPVIACWRTRRALRRARRPCEGNEINWTRWNCCIGFDKGNRRWRR